MNSRQRLYNRAPFSCLLFVVSIGVLGYGGQAQQIATLILLVVWMLAILAIRFYLTRRPISKLMALLINFPVFGFIVAMLAGFGIANSGAMVALFLTPHFSMLRLPNVLLAQESIDELVENGKKY